MPASYPDRKRFRSRKAGGGAAVRAAEGKGFTAVSERSDGGHVLGFRQSDTVRMVEKVRAGFEYQALVRFCEAVGVSLQEAAEVVRIKPRTLARRKEEGRLHPDESERLLRVSRIYEKALELHEGDGPGAKRWLTTPKGVLGGETPLRFAQTEVGAREVENLIGRLEHGVFS